MRKMKKVNRSRRIRNNRKRINRNKSRRNTIRGGTIVRLNTEYGPATIFPFIEQYDIVLGELQNCNVYINSHNGFILLGHFVNLSKVEIPEAKRIGNATTSNFDIFQSFTSMDPNYTLSSVLNKDLNKATDYYTLSYEILNKRSTEFFRKLISIQDKIKFNSI